MAVVALLGWLGAEFGSRRFRLPAIRNLLAGVLALAGTKMIPTA
jgi:VIT1/CCC1 family predicted Fe2+/Mn2+ transporter